MNIKQIISRISRDLIADSIFSFTPGIVTNFFYPNGDSINLYLSQSQGKLIVSDNGSTIDGLINSGVELTRERKETIGLICKREGLSFDGRNVSGVMSMRSPNDDVLGICQSLTHISSLHFHQSQSKRSPLPEEISTLLREKVKRSFQTQWSDREIDPDGAFPVDYHFNGEAARRNRNLFYVTSGGKALLVAAVAQFLRAKGAYAPTIAVIDKEADVHGKQIERVQLSSDEIKFGIKGHEREIVNFVEAD